MSAPTQERWYRRGGGAALGMLAIVVLGVGLGFGRADVALLGLPLAATAAVALRRPVGTASVAVAVAVEDDDVVVRVRVEGAAGADFAVLAAGAYEEPTTTVVVSSRTAASLEARLPVLHSGPQEVLRVGGQLFAAGADLVQHLDPQVARATIAPKRERVTSLLLPHRLTNRPGGHAARRLGDGLDFRDLAPFTPGDRLRRIDWRATARSPRPESELIVRRMDATAEAAAVIVLDSRDDVGAAVVEWGSDRPARKGTASLDLARPAVAAIAASYLEAGDRVAFHDLVRTGASARSGGGRRKLEQIRAVVTQTVARPSGTIKAPVLPTAAVVFLVSTFLDEDVAGLAVLWRNAGHRVVAIDVLPTPTLEGADEAHRLAHRILQLERADRLDRLRRVDVTVVPWQDEDHDALLRQAARSRGPR
ncbi:DUF58 domain-containing protein [Amnibacterium kyonggiense]|uniref:Uncharacterized protein (DUF58 family) n=1 Tax=Amnibacterium kyonggiense TaxID=595671 RepID=A0A4R7FSZ5_9MICO|nr:DUF58 domain-containing protein [Amnibacterium kyonggiense]TDS80898.1 uncharacterized protein (DUF58 family) [Amnibacterium kyonggiense]